jgi:prevent-host-death family protein
MRTVNDSEFKAKCFAILDEVEETGEPVTILKRGRPVARLRYRRESVTLSRRSWAASTFSAISWSPSFLQAKYPRQHIIVWRGKTIIPPVAKRRGTT